MRANLTMTEHVHVNLDEHYYVPFAHRISRGAKRQNNAQDGDEIWCQAHWPWLHAWPWIDRRWSDTVQIQRSYWPGVPHTGGEATIVSSFYTSGPCGFTLIKRHQTRDYTYYIRAFCEYSIFMWCFQTWREQTGDKPEKEQVDMLENALWEIGRNDLRRLIRR